MKLISHVSKAEQEFLEKEMDKIFGGKSDTSAHSMRQELKDSTNRGLD